jgi:hypothetical protein
VTVGQVDLLEYPLSFYPVFLHRETRTMTLLRSDE